LLRARKRSICLMVVVAMLATFFVGVPAASAAEYRALRVNYSIPDDTTSALGTIRISFAESEIRDGDSVLISLPSDFKFAAALSDGEDEDAQSESAWQPGGTGLNKFEIPATVSNEPNGLLGATYTVDVRDDNEIQLTVSNVAYSERESVLNLVLGAVYVPDGEGEDINVTFESLNGGGFSDSSVLVGRTTGAAVTISATDTDTSNNEFDVTFRIKEATTGSLEKDASSVKFTLPDGYVWKTGSFDRTADTKTISGTSITSMLHATEPVVFDEDVAKLNIATESTTASGGASYFEITLTFEVDDESEVEPGDITAKVGGESSASPSTLVVGKYADYGATLAADGDVPTIVAGFQEQDIVDLVLKEGLKESLVKGRTVTLELPAAARWQSAVVGTALDGSDEDEGLSLSPSGFTGTSDRTAKFTIDISGTKNVSSGAAEVTLEGDEHQVVVQPGFSGDLKVTVGGSAGLTGEIVIAKVVTPISMEASTKPVLQIGKAGQAAGDITITENAAEALAEGLLTLKLPDDVLWDGVPDIEVTEGDLKIDEDSADTDDEILTFEVTRESDTASVIKISNIQYKVYRTIPEGDIKVSVEASEAAGDVVGWADPSNSNIDINPWKNNTTAASVVNATCGTPAGELSGTAVFTIGSTAYTLNGVEQTMDVAPYIKDSRTYMPLRFAAQAAGVTDANIMWNQADRSVVLVKGDRVVKLVIGSKTMLVNGIPVSMDVAPEIVSDRTMLPVRWLAQALGCEVLWDEATQTVTIQ
jgi:hypothetical protein